MLHQFTHPYSDDVTVFKYVVDRVVNDITAVDHDKNVTFGFIV